MKTFFSTSQTVEVSRITKEGWWIENTSELVTKGTALGDDFTQNIYTPSIEGMIARYDRELGTWSDEIEDMTMKKYFDKDGQQFFIREPDGSYPEDAIVEAPPKYNKETHTVLYKDGGWKVFDILIGQSFFDEYGNEFLVSDYNFELPEKHTFTKPPELCLDNRAVKLVDGQWQQLLDYRGKMAYAKDRDNGTDYQIEELGELPETHTLSAPDPFDSWIDEGWKYDIERHRPFKVGEEKQWRDSELTKVLDRIDQYEKDQNYPVELRTSPIQANEDYMRLLQDRKNLSVYPESSYFPFGERPLLSGLAK